MVSKYLERKIKAFLAETLTISFFAGVIVGATITAAIAAVTRRKQS